MKARHLRPRGHGVEQPITTVELFFDLVYVFAVTQLSHMILGDLTVAEVGRAAFPAADRVVGSARVLNRERRADPLHSRAEVG